MIHMYPQTSPGDKGSHVPYLTSMSNTPQLLTHDIHTFFRMYPQTSSGDKGSQGSPHGSLDQVDRRWAWFRRLLKAVDAKFSSVCPLHWRVPLRLTFEFVERTKGHLAAVLMALESKDAMDVHALLKALQTTLRFEQVHSCRCRV